MHTTGGDFFFFGIFGVNKKRMKAVTKESNIFMNNSVVSA